MSRICKITVSLLSAVLLLTALVSAASCTPPDAGQNDPASGTAEVDMTGSGSTDTLTEEATKGLVSDTDTQPAEPHTTDAQTEPAESETTVSDIPAVGTDTGADTVADTVADNSTDAVSDAETDTEPQEETTTSGNIVLPKDWF